MEVIRITNENPLQQQKLIDDRSDGLFYRTIWPIYSVHYEINLDFLNLKRGKEKVEKYHSRWATLKLCPSTAL